MTVRVGIIGTSWWADGMYLPALQDHPHGKFVAVCGRNRETAQKLADTYGVPEVYTDYREMIASGKLDAIIISTPNDTHLAMTEAALNAGLHVMCEKPLAMNYAEAKRMAALAAEKGVKHLVPYTYRHLPMYRYLKDLISGGYIGQPYQLNMRYNSGYGRAGEYMWRFDTRYGGTGVLGDLGSHFLHLAKLYFGAITGVYCKLSHRVPRVPLDPQGQPYTPTDDSALMTLAFANGAQGSVSVSSLCYEGTTFNQTHHMEFHGSEGTLYSDLDFNSTQEIRGAREEEGTPPAVMSIPELYWGNARRDTVKNTLRDVFRTQDFMSREFVTAIAENTPLQPDFEEGLAIQRVLDACALSDRERRWVDVEEIV
jgi:predicted dehydrogenase